MGPVVCKLALANTGVEILCRIGWERVEMKASQGSGNGKEEDNNGKSNPELLNPPNNSQGNHFTASSDDELKNIFHQIKASKTPAVINYGASWCRVCSQILPTFNQLSSQFPKLSFIYADIDECPETTQHIRYTPTFHFYRDGERVDEMFGSGKERLRDRLWLHS